MFIKSKKIVLVTGGFDPLHSGHMKLLIEAAKLGEVLYVGLNSNQWLIEKKGFYFLPINERKQIIENLRMVNQVILWDDKDKSACGAINYVLSKLSSDQVLIFANGGDRKEDNIPEVNVFKNNNKVEFRFGIGGNTKLNSSSKILKNFESYLNNRVI